MHRSIRAAALVRPLALALALTNCATTSDVLTGEPDEIFRIAQSPEQVAACFEKSNSTRVIERADGARVALFRNGYGGVVKIFSIYPDGTGSRIETRHSSIGVPGIRWKTCVGLAATR